jgi:hypothetical protein
LDQREGAREKLEGKFSKMVVGGGREGCIFGLKGVGTLVVGGGG